MKSFQAQTHYEVLEISVGATAAEVRTAFDRLTQLYSDDQVVLYGLIDPNRAAALRSRLKEALEILSDEPRRDAYDVKIGLPPREGAKPVPAPKPLVPRTASGASAATGWGGFAWVTPATGAQPPAPQGSYTYTMSPQSVPVPAVAAPVVVVTAPAPRPAAVVEAVSALPPPAPTVVVVPPPSAPVAVPSAPTVVAVPPPTAPAAAPSASVEAPSARVAAPSAPVAPPVEVAPPLDEVRQLDLLSGPLNAWGGRSTEREPVAELPPPLPVPPVILAPAAEPVEVVVAAVAPVVAAAPVPEPVVVPEPEVPRLADDAVEVSIVPARATPAREFRIEQRSKAYEVPSDVEFNGDLLRQVRMARGLSLVQLAERTRIGVKHLENLEGDRYDALPAAVYLRGILMNVARELGLDGLRVSKSYLTFVDAHRSKG